ncbi:MAG: hypothetical protein ACRD26_23575 [Vicinamibacterales bacterium]
MATPQELYDTMLVAVRRVASARQARLEARSALQRAEDEVAAADAELASARAAVDEEIDFATGRRQRDLPAPVDVR